MESVQHAVESLFARCDGSKNKSAAFRRASSMVRYLARSRHRPHLAHLASALHEQRMVLEMAQIKDSRRVRQHATYRDQALAEFYRVYEDLIEFTRF